MDRTELHKKLVNILGSNHVYFQPPETIRLTYPCIVYRYDGDNDKYADDIHYVSKKKYSITVITSDPDSVIHEDIKNSFKLCSLNRTYTADNLYHYALQLFY